MRTGICNIHWTARWFDFKKASFEMCKFFLFCLGIFKPRWESNKEILSNKKIQIRKKNWIIFTLNARLVDVELGVWLLVVHYKQMILLSSTFRIHFFQSNYRLAMLMTLEKDLSKTCPLHKINFLKYFFFLVKLLRTNYIIKIFLTTLSFCLQVKKSLKKQ